MDSTSSSIPKRQPGLCLKFIVVGGSIAGLSVAYALQSAGHHVKLIERTDGTYRSPGAVRCPPNMSRILQSWGLGSWLNEVGVECLEVAIRNGETGDEIGALPLFTRYSAKKDDHYYLLLHGQLYSTLQKLAVDEGVRILYNTTVTKVDPRIVSVTLDNGTTLLADVVIGADGPQSMVRAIVQNHPTPTKQLDQLAISVVVPASVLQADPEMEPLVRPGTWTQWAGNDFYANGSLVDSCKQYTLCMYTSIEGDERPPLDESWERRYSVDKLNINLERFGPRIQKILRLAKEVSVLNCLAREPYGDPVDESAKVCLVGEAGHPMIPSDVNNAALAIEDGCILLHLFSGITRMDQISRLLTAYEEIRQPRWAAVDEADDAQRRMLSLPAGKEREERDAAVHALQEEGKEAAHEAVAKMWKDAVEVYSYDAQETVDDWYSKWERILDRPVESADDVEL